MITYRQLNSLHNFKSKLLHVPIPSFRGCQSELYKSTNPSKKQNVMENPIVLAFLKQRKYYLHSIYSQLWMEAGGEPVYDMKLIKNFLNEDIDYLKEHQYLKRNADVTSSMLSALEQFPYDSAKPVQDPKAVAKLLKTQSRKKLKEDVKQLFNEIELIPVENTIIGIKHGIVRQYYAWKLKSVLNVIDFNYLLCEKCQKINSLTNVGINLHMLLHDFKISEENILKNFAVTAVNPADLRFFIENESLFPIDVRTVIKEHIKILDYLPHQILETSHVLTEYGVTEEQIKNLPKIFAYTTENILEKLRQCSKKSSKLKLHKDHPRFLELLIMAKKIEESLNESEKTESSVYSVNSLISLPKKEASSKFKEGNFVSSACKDIALLVSQTLGLDITDVHNKLKANSYTHHVPLSQVKTTLDFLLSSNFEKEVIAESLDIVLYPKIYLQRMLLKINKEDGESVKDSSFLCGSKLKDRRLALCLYYIEKETYYKRDNQLVKS